MPGRHSQRREKNNINNIDDTILCLCFYWAPFIGFISNTVRSTEQSHKKKRQRGWLDKWDGEIRLVRFPHISESDIDLLYTQQDCAL